jgi:predicted transcriptional regulator
MGSVSSAHADRARKIESIILRRLAEVGQTHAAVSMGVSESTVSRLKDGELEKIASFLAAIGLKTVPVEKKCFDEAEVAALMTLANRAMRQIGSSVDSLVFDD